ncbi:hypothetical protein PIB30_017508 [Stylosanthes scabra]|uniref:Uncharacterized protein n=1 Tax=Stylosanthes scabra TaxID=79078 RepID=A0ABU6R803_9FABA|nr:hypothetical protein [Stylosanthes scabra]
MELENCQCLSMITTSYERIGGGDYDDDYDSASSSSSIIVCVNEESMTRLKVACWRTLWRKIKKEKKRFFNNNNNKKKKNSSSHVQYDPNSYLQNFDDGYYCSYSSDPDIFSRSFSARFAMPSKYFDKNNDEAIEEEDEEQEEEESEEILDQ